MSHSLIQLGASLLAIGGIPSEPPLEACPAIQAHQDVMLQEGSVTVKGVPIHYVEAGRADAPMMILVHGFMTYGRQNWGAAIPALSEHFRVIVIDARGHGKSGKPHDIDAYGVNLAEDVIAVMDSFGVKKAHVGGFSMGGLIALYLAANHPDRLSSAIVGGFGLRNAPVPTEGGPIDAALDEAIRTGDSVSEVLIRQNGQYAGAEVFRYEPIMRFYQELGAASSDPVALRMAHKSLPALHVSADQASAIDVPLLAISGDRDPAVSDMMALRAANPRTALALVPFCGHLNAAVSEPFVRMMIDFARNPAP